MTSSNDIRVKIEHENEPVISDEVFDRGAGEVGIDCAAKECFYFFESFFWVDVFTVAELAPLEGSGLFVEGEPGTGKEFLNDTLCPCGEAVCDQFKSEVGDIRKSGQVTDETAVCLLPILSDDDGGDHETQGVACRGNLYGGCQALFKGGCGVFIFSDYLRSINREPEPGCSPVVESKEGVDGSEFGNEAKASLGLPGKKLDRLGKCTGVRFDREGIRGGRPLKDGNLRESVVDVAGGQIQNFVLVYVDPHIGRTAKIGEKIAVLTDPGAACGQRKLVLCRGAAGLEFFAASDSYNKGALGVKKPFTARFSRNPCDAIVRSC